MQPCQSTCYNTFSYQGPKRLNPRNETAQALSSLYQKWVRTQCSSICLDPSDDFEGVLIQDEIKYSDQFEKVAKLASEKQFQKDCEEMKSELCQSRLSIIFTNIPNEFLQNLCKGKEKKL